MAQKGACRRRLELELEACAALLGRVETKGGIGSTRGNLQRTGEHKEATARSPENHWLLPGNPKSVFVTMTVSRYHTRKGTRGLERWLSGY